MDFLNCNWDQANFLIFSKNVYDPLIYYSHLLPLVSALILGIFVFFSNKKLLVNKLFFLLTILFSIWTYFDLILWATQLVDAKANDLETLNPTSLSLQQRNAREVCGVW